MNRSGRDADLIVITDGIGQLTDDCLQCFRLKQQSLLFSVYGVMIGSRQGREGIATLQRFCQRCWQVNDLAEDGSEIRELFSL